MSGLHFQQGRRGRRFVEMEGSFRIFVTDGILESLEIRVGLKMLLKRVKTSVYGFKGINIGVRKILSDMRCKLSLISAHIENAMDARLLEPLVAQRFFFLDGSNEADVYAHAAQQALKQAFKRHECGY